MTPIEQAMTDVVTAFTLGAGAGLCLVVAVVLLSRSGRG